MEPIPFRALLVTAGKLTRDGRMIEPGGVTWTVPMSLLVMLNDGHGGEPGPTDVAGRIDTITLEGSDYWADGFLTTEIGMYQVAPMIADLSLTGISVDLAPTVIEYRSMAQPGEQDGPTQQTPEEAANPMPVVEEAEPVERVTIGDTVMVFVETEIVAATICAKPAMAGAYIELVTGQPVDDQAAIAAGATPCGCTRDVFRLTHTLVAAAPEVEPDPADPNEAAEGSDQPDNSGGAMIALYAPEMGSLAIDGGLPSGELHITLAYLGDASAVADQADELAAICQELASSLEAGDGRIAGPAAFVNDPDPEDPANVPLVALIDSPWICDLRMALCDALDASGIDQPSEHGFIPHMTLKYDTAPSLVDVGQAALTFPAVSLVIGGNRQDFPCGSSLTASALGLAPLEPPAEWFDDPAFTEPTPLTIDDDGRVFGHIAAWGVCHTGFARECVRAPKSRSGYSYFHLGEVVCDDGSRVDVGQITLDTSHANLAQTRRDATRHYDHTGHAVADVRAGEDAFGIWVAGAVRPDVEANALRRLRGSKISGDWRNVEGKGLELVAALAVNVPGFPVPRVQARIASGIVEALIGQDIGPQRGEDSRYLGDALVDLIEHGDQALALAASALEAA